MSGNSSSIELDIFSQVTAHLTLVARHDGKETILAAASGFFVDIRGRLFLVTAWHNLTGRRPRDLKPEHSKVGIPTHVRVRATYRYDELVSLYYDDSYNDVEKCRRAFWQHPKGPRIDVAVIEVPKNRNVKALPENRLSAHPANRQPFRVRQVCYAIGYPHGLVDFSYDGYIVPIHKVASIASEPLADYMQEPIILIDIVARKGMSGSLVLAEFYSHSGLVRDDQILGLYAGRYFTPIEERFVEHVGLSQQTEDSGVGYVFKSEAILEVFSQIKGDIPSEVGLLPCPVD